MVGMKEGGYDEKYRKLVLEKALKNYDRMMKDSSMTKRLAEGRENEGKKKEETHLGH